VYNADLTERLALALKGLGCQEAMVVHGLDGLDEISTVGKTQVARLKDGTVTICQVTPKDFGLKQAKTADLLGGTAEENAQTLFKILGGKTQKGNPQTDIVLANSAAALVVGGKADDLQGGVEIAREALQSGSAVKKLEALVRVSGGDLGKLKEMAERYE
jgi:anthranilate phosphoribosyltransferase